MASLAELLGLVPPSQLPMTAGTMQRTGVDELGNPTMRDVMGQNYMADYSAYEPQGPQAEGPGLMDILSAPYRLAGGRGSEQDAAAMQPIIDGLMQGYTAPGRALSGEDMRMGDVFATALDYGLAGAPMTAPEGALRANSFRAFHGSPHTFDQFDLSNMGTGEGVQAEGAGLYFAENPAVAERYRDLTRHRTDGANPGVLYEVNINADPKSFLDWNAPLQGQPENVRAWLDSRGISEGFAGQQSGAELMMAERGLLGDQGVAQSMREAGVPGISFLDAGSRAAGDGSRNFVVFDDKIIEILRRYGIGAAAIGGGWSVTPDEYDAVIGAEQRG